MLDTITCYSRPAQLWVQVKSVMDCSLVKTLAMLSCVWCIIHIHWCCSRHLFSPRTVWRCTNPLSSTLLRRRSGPWSIHRPQIFRRFSLSSIYVWAASGGLYCVEWTVWCHGSRWQLWPVSFTVICHFSVTSH